MRICFLCRGKKKFTVFNAATRALDVHPLPESREKFLRGAYCPLCLPQILVFMIEDNACFCSNRNLVRLYRHLDCLLVLLDRTPVFENDQQRTEKARSRGSLIIIYLKVIWFAVERRTTRFEPIVNCPLWNDVMDMKFSKEN